MASINRLNAQRRKAPGARRKPWYTRDGYRAGWTPPAEVVPVYVDGVILNDDFATDTGLFTGSNGANPAIAGGVMTCTPTTGYYRKATPITYDLWGKSAEFYDVASMFDGSVASAAFWCRVQPSTADGERLQWDTFVSGGVVQLRAARVSAAGSVSAIATLTYSATTHRHLRIRHDRSTNLIYWDYRGTTGDWVNAATYSLFLNWGYDLANVSLNIGSGLSTGTASSNPTVGGVYIGPATTVSSAQIVAVTTTTETDTAQPVGRAKVRALGTAVETDAPIAVGRIKTRAVGINAEVDAGQQLGRAKARALGIAAETDTALATPRKTGLTGPLNPATETDAAQPVGRAKVRALGTAVETDTAVAVGRSKKKAVGIATETDAAQPLGRRKVKATTIPLEADASIALARTKLRLSNFTVETDAAIAFGRMKAKALAIALESETALPLTASGTQFATFVAHGGLTSLTTTANVPYPTGLASGDVILFFVNSIDSTISSGTPAGFTAGPTISGGSAGDSRLYYKTSNGTESGTVTVTTTAGTKGRGLMAAYRPPAGKSLSVALTYTGTDTTSNTQVSVDFAAVAAAAKDTIVTWVAGAGDFTAGAFSGFDIADSGVTFGPLGTRANGRTGTNTAQHFLLDRNVAVGGTATATATGTGNATTATGNGIAVLLRPTSTAITLALGTATETDAGQPLGRVRSRLLGIPLYAGGYGEGGYGEGGYGSGLSTSDQAMPMTRTEPNYLNTTIENDVASPVGRVKSRLLGVAVESDVAQHLAHGIIRALGTAVEVDTAVDLTVRQSEILVRIVRSALPQPVDAMVDIGGYGATSRFQRALRRGSVVQRALLLTPPSLEHPAGLVTVTSDPSVVARWDAESVILDPAGVVLDNQSWQAQVLAANGYTLEAAP